MEPNKKTKMITAGNLEEKLDKGEDVSEYFDFDNAVVRFPGSAPKWALSIIEEEAKRRGSSREAYIREMLVERAEKIRRGTHGLQAKDLISEKDEADVSPIDKEFMRRVMDLARRMERKKQLTLSRKKKKKKKARSQRIIGKLVAKRSQKKFAKNV